MGFTQHEVRAHTHTDRHHKSSSIQAEADIGDTYITGYVQMLLKIHTPVTGEMVFNSVI